MLDALDHVILAVSDLAVATRDMTRLLGRTPSWRGEHPAMGTANTLFRLSNTYVELLAPVGEGAVAGMLRNHLDERGEGPFGLAFRTADASACYDAWKSQGLHPAEPNAGLGRDEGSGAFREWTNVHLPPSDTNGILLFAIEHRTPDAVLPEARPLGDEEAAISGLDHAVIQTLNPDRAKTLFGDHLGLRLGLDREFPKWGSRMMFFRVGAATIEVVASLKPDGNVPSAASAAGGPTPDEDRFWGISWRADHAAAAQSRMEGDGLDVSELRDGRKPDTFVFTVREPTHGVPTLVKQPTPRETGEKSDG